MLSKTRIVLFGTRECWKKKPGRTQTMASMWKKLMKLVGSWKTDICLDHLYLGCAQSECKPNKIIFEQCKKNCLNHVFLLEQLTNDQDAKPKCSNSAGATHKFFLGGKNLTKKTVAWSYDVEGHAKKCVERYCILANKKTEKLYKVSTTCLDDHHFKKEELESVGELSKVSSQIV